MNAPPHACSPLPPHPLTGPAWEGRGPLPAQPHLGCLLRAFRAEQDLTVNALAARTGVARSQLCAMLAGSAAPGPKVARRLRQVLGQAPPSARALADHAQPPARSAVEQTALRVLVQGALEESGGSMSSLAERAGVGRTALFSWLSGQTRPGARHTIALAAALQVPVADVAAAVGGPSLAPTTATQRLRLERGWTLAALASRAGVAVTALRRLERGAPVRPATVSAVAAVLEVSPAELGACPAPARAAASTSKFADAVAGALRERAWTATQLARHLGVHRQQLSAWRSGVDPVPVRYVPALAAVLGVPAGQLQEVLALEWAERPSAQAARRRCAARTASGLRQRDLAERAGIAHTTYTRWECGRGYLGDGHVAAVAAVLGVDADTLR